MTLATILGIEADARSAFRRTGFFDTNKWVETFAFFQTEKMRTPTIDNPRQFNPFERPTMDEYQRARIWLINNGLA